MSGVLQSQIQTQETAASQAVAEVSQVHPPVSLLRGYHSQVCLLTGSRGTTIQPLKALLTVTVIQNKFPAFLPEIFRQEPRTETNTTATLNTLVKKKSL